MAPQFLLDRQRQPAGATRPAVHHARAAGLGKMLDVQQHLALHDEAARFQEHAIEEGIPGAAVKVQPEAFDQACRAIRILIQIESSGHGHKIARPDEL